MKALKEERIDWKADYGDEWPKRALQEIADEYLLFSLLRGEAEEDTTTLYRWLEEMIMAGVAATETIEKFEDEIEETIAEFSDLPEQCLSMISEHIQHRRHFRAHQNARSEDL